MTDHLFDTGPSGSDLFLFQDDGVLGNAMGQLAVASGGFSPLALGYPDGAIVVSGTAGQDYLFDLPDSLAATDLVIGSVTAPSSSPDGIRLQTVTTTGLLQFAAQKAISESGADAGIDVTAGRLALSAGTGIGVDNAIETRADFLEGLTQAGDIRIVNHGAVTIGDAHPDLNGLSVATSGDIDLTAYGSITLAAFGGLGFSVRAGYGDVRLAAMGYQSSIGSSGDQSAVTAGGSVRLDAGADILFGIGTYAGNFVTAVGDVDLSAGRDVYIDGLTQVCSDNFGTASGGSVTVTAGRDIHVAGAYNDYASIVAWGFAGGDVRLKTGANGGLFVSAPHAGAIKSNSGDVTADADVIAIEPDSGISAAGTVTLRPSTAGRAIDLGGVPDPAWALTLSDGELDRIFAQRLVIGGPAAGDIVVSADIGPANAAELVLQSGGNILVSACDVLAAGSLTLRAAGDVALATGAALGAGGAVTLYVDYADSDAAAGGRASVDAAFATALRLVGAADVDTLSGGAGNDTLEGGRGADVLRGRSGNDTYVLNGPDQIIEAAGEGVDTVQTSADYALGAELENVRLTGADAAAASGNGLDNRLIGSKGANALQGLDGDDLLSGGRGWDQLAGGAGKDTLIGGAAGDALYGGAGNDTLFGGGGSDSFVFDTAPHSGFNRDTVEDFNPAEDIVFLDDAVFARLAPGVLPAARFSIGPAAADASDRIIYDDAAGALLYDRDGSGAAAAVQFAMLEPGLALTNADFFVY